MNQRQRAVEEGLDDVCPVCHGLDPECCACGVCEGCCTAFISIADIQRAEAENVDAWERTHLSRDKNLGIRSRP